MNLVKLYGGVSFLFFSVWLFIIAGWLYSIIAMAVVLAILALVFILWRNRYNGKTTIMVSRIVVILAFLLIVISIVMISDTYINGTKYYDYSPIECGYCGGTGRLSGGGICKLCNGNGGNVNIDDRYIATEIGRNGWVLLFESAMLMCGMIFGLNDADKSIFTIFNPINENKTHLFKKLFLIGFLLVFIIGFIDIYASTSGFQEIYCGMLQNIVGNKPYSSAYSAAFLWVLFSLLSGLGLSGIGA